MLNVPEDSGAAWCKVIPQQWEKCLHEFKVSTQTLIHNFLSLSTFQFKPPWFMNSLSFVLFMFNWTRKCIFIFLHLSLSNCNQVDWNPLVKLFPSESAFLHLVLSFSSSSTQINWTLSCNDNLVLFSLPLPSLQQWNWWKRAWHKIYPDSCIRTIMVSCQSRLFASFGPLEATEILATDRWSNIRGNTVTRTTSDLSFFLSLSLSFSPLIHHNQRE